MQERFKFTIVFIFELYEKWLYIYEAFVPCNTFAKDVD